MPKVKWGQAPFQFLRTTGNATAARRRQPGVRTRTVSQKLKWGLSQKLKWGLSPLQTGKN
jgi:hypothetical protein